MSDLKDIKVGEYVKVNNDYSRGFRLYRVDRLTKTQVVCGTVKFSKDSGKRIGLSGWYAQYGYKAMEEDFYASEVERCRKLIEKSIPTMNDEMVINIAKMINESIELNGSEK